MILAGDVGGTKTVLALFAERDGTLALQREEVLTSHEFPTLESAIERFLTGGPAGTIHAACLGVAGPVVDGRWEAVNLPWKLDEATLATTVGAKRAKLLNDLEATGHGMLGLPPSSLVSLQTGVARRGNMALLAAGTGLGEALIVWDGARHLAVGSEGGHVDFAARTDLEVELLQFLRREFGRVSYERVLSGPGILNVYRFLRARSRVPEPDWLRARMAGGDPSAVISESALAERDACCVEALDLFVSIYGAEAGNLALKCVAVGGVYVGGGIAPKMLPALQKGGFLKAFIDKGRFDKLMKTLEVNVALNPRAPLIGAAHYALRLV